MYVSGTRNPFRLHTFNGAIYQTDTGWYTWEEVGGTRFRVSGS